MNKVELKEMDEGILRFWEDKVLLETIELQYPKARSRIQSYRNLGVVDSGREVNWAKFKEADPPLMRGGMAKSHTSRHTERMADSHIHAISKRHTSAIPGMALSAEDTDTLRELLTWWKTRKEDGGVQGGEKQKATFWIDEGLLKALKARSKKEGSSQAEIVAQALRAYFGG